MALIKHSLHRGPADVILGMQHDAGACDRLIRDITRDFAACVAILRVDLPFLQIMIEKDHVKGGLFQSFHRGSGMAANRQLVRLETVFKERDPARIIIEQQNIQSPNPSILWTRPT